MGTSYSISRQVEPASAKGTQILNAILHGRGTMETTQMCNNLEVDATTRQFIARLSHEIRSGYGIVPFVGSGMSARSGILMGEEFTEFLAHVFYVVVARPEDRWDLRTTGWPKFPTKTEVGYARQWILDQFLRVCERNHMKPIYDANQRVIDVSLEGSSAKLGSPNFAMMLNRPFIPSIIRGGAGWKRDQQLKELLRQFRPSDDKHRPSEFVAKRGYSPSSVTHLVEVGIRSLHDWRATLEFLSRVVVGSNGVLRLESRDPSVIDNFNVHITRNKQCNLGHKMLAHLSRPLRIRTILTTNFDELIEDAYGQIALPLKTFEVSIKGALPHYRTVRMQNSLVKLHGGMLETRADYSLDAEPTRDDKDRFAQYVAGPFGEAGGIPSHLLVVGYSGSDLRCVQMIKHLLDVNKEVRIFGFASARQTSIALSGFSVKMNTSLVFLPS